MAARSSPPSPLTMSRASSLARSRRERPSSSRALMLAVESMMIMVLPEASERIVMRGRASAKTRARKRHELQQEEKAATQFFERGVCFYFFKRALPQENARHHAPLALEFEQIEKDDYRAREHPPQRARRKQSHIKNPATVMARLRL